MNEGAARRRVVSQVTMGLDVAGLPLPLPTCAPHLSHLPASVQIPESSSAPPTPDSISH